MPFTSSMMKLTAVLKANWSMSRVTFIIVRCVRLRMARCLEAVRSAAAPVSIMGRKRSCTSRQMRPRNRCAPSTPASLQSLESSGGPMNRRYSLSVSAPSLSM